MKIKIRKGYDMPLAGGVENLATEDRRVRRCALFPGDYPGIQPRLSVKEGDTVSAGDSIFYDKIHNQVNICSPISGLITKVVRGEKRRLEYVEIESETDQEPNCVSPVSPQVSDASSMMDAMCRAGFLSQIRQRPYDIVPSPDVMPRDIFVSCIDSSPLAAPLWINPAVTDEYASEGLAVLASLTTGKVYLDTDTMHSERARSIVEGCRSKNVEAVEFAGPHPVGNPGIQASHIKPVNKGETIWTLSLPTLCRIGIYFKQGIFEPRVAVAITGSEVKRPYIAITLAGAEIGPLLKDDLKDEGRHQRIISGNVLTGVKINADGFLHFPWRQLTVIPEGDDKDEFLGWASMSPGKLSVGKTFPLSKLRKSFSPDARLQGGRRAMILSGIYDKMIPMDIYPEYLVKAILGRDIDSMEKLGIYEVAPEDFALAEFADPSKLPLQKIVREGLDYLRKENQ